MDENLIWYAAPYNYVYMSVADQLAPTSRETNKWECEVCGKIFDSWYIYSYHKLLEHSKEARPPIGIG